MPMIKCSDCNNEMSDSATACPKCGKPNAKVNQQDNNEERKLGSLLTIGIVLLPIIFVWFTLRKGYSKKVKTISFTYLVLGLLFVIFSPDPNESNLNTNSSNASDAVLVMEVDIRTVLSDYEANEVGADNKYKGKMIQVTGIVSSIKKDIINDIYVTLGTGKQFEMPQIQAFFNDSMNDQLGALKKGSKLSVICEVDGLMMNVIARDCLIN